MTEILQADGEIILWLLGLDEADELCTETKSKVQELCPTHVKPDGPTLDWEDGK